MIKKNSPWPAFAAIAVVVSALIGGLLIWNSKGTDRSAGEGLPSATDQQLKTVEGAKVYFAHQSVGGNIIDALPELYRQRGLPAPTVVQTTDRIPDSGGVLAHSFIGENGDPEGKIAQFDSVMRGGMGDQVDVALMKLCYVDVMSGTDVKTLFAQYKDTMRRLERDYPDVTFVYVTTPLTTEPGMKAKVKTLLGRPDNNGAEHNVAREEFNALMRQEYAGTGRLFDLAAVQSTDPTGSRITGEQDGRQYFAMYEGYSSDPGHLNPYGAAVAGEDLMAAIADAIGADRA